MINYRIYQDSERFFSENVLHWKDFVRGSLSLSGKKARAGNTIPAILWVLLTGTSTNSASGKSGREGDRNAATRRWFFHKYKILEAATTHY